jgi:GTP-binding protein HflX
MEQMNIVNKVLKDLGAEEKEQIIIFNKCDLKPANAGELNAVIGQSLRISAFNDNDLERLKLTIQDKLGSASKMFRIPADKGDLIALLYRIGEVLETDADGDDMLFQVRVNAADYTQNGYLLASYEQNGPVEEGARL